MGTQARIASLQKRLAKKKLDGLLLFVVDELKNPNVPYLCGFSGTEGILLVTADDAFMVVDGRYFGRVKSEVSNCRIVKAVRHEEEHDLINRTLKIAKLSKKSRIGFEAEAMSVATLRRLREEIKAQLVPTNNVVERLRQAKDQSEISLLQKACDITCGVYGEVVQIIKPGMAEDEVAFEIDMRLRRNGCSGCSFETIVASGPNSAIPHHATSKRKLEAGEPVVMDFGGVYGGYCADITRTVFVPGKEPASKMADIYRVVKAAQDAATAALKPGVMYDDYEAVACKVIKKAGYAKYFTHGLGHSLGMVTHDPYRYDDDAFEVGTVMTNEPGIYVPGVGGVRIEDDFVVTKSGARKLTTAPYWF